MRCLPRNRGTRALTLGDRITTALVGKALPYGGQGTTPPRGMRFRPVDPRDDPWAWEWEMMRRARWGTKAAGMTGSERVRGAYRGRPAGLETLYRQGIPYGVPGIRYPRPPGAGAPTLSHLVHRVNQRLLQLRDQAARQQGRRV